MKCRYLIPVLIFMMLLCSSWGFFAHMRINRLAVFTLPTDLIGFYKSNIDYIAAHAPDPDKRRYVDSLEAPRHYLDADHYGESPFDSIPKKWQDAVDKYSEKELLAYGIVPWQIQRSYFQLVKAFEARNSERILKISADIGHYIADAHVPLHTTENYNGQLSNQVGIHALWESRLPELFADDYDYFVGRARYIQSPLNEAWKILEHTFSLLDSTLLIEKRISGNFPSDQKYTFSERNNKVIREYSLDYSRAYHDAMMGMVEEQMRRSILAVGSFWYSAWVDAGQPDMDNIIHEKTSEETDTQTSLHQQHDANGEMIGRPEY